MHNESYVQTKEREIIYSLHKKTQSERHNPEKWLRARDSAYTAKQFSIVIDKKNTN